MQGWVCITKIPKAQIFAIPTQLWHSAFHLRNHRGSNGNNFACLEHFKTTHTGENVLWGPKQVGAGAAVGDGSSTCTIPAFPYPLSPPGLIFSSLCAKGIQRRRNTDPWEHRAGSRRETDNCTITALLLLHFFSSLHYSPFCPTLPWLPWEGNQSHVAAKPASLCANPFPGFWAGRRLLTSWTYCEWAAENCISSSQIPVTDFQGWAVLPSLKNTGNVWDGWQKIQCMTGTIFKRLFHNSITITAVLSAAPANISQGGSSSLSAHSWVINRANILDTAPFLGITALPTGTRKHFCAQPFPLWSQTTSSFSTGHLNPGILSKLGMFIFEEHKAQGCSCTWDLRVGLPQDASSLAPEMSHASELWETDVPALPGSLRQKFWKIYTPDNPAAGCGSELAAQPHLRDALDHRNVMWLMFHHCILTTALAAQKPKFLQFYGKLQWCGDVGRDKII